MRVDLTREDLIANTRRCGLCVIGQTGNLVPADKQLYALRDVTGTVDSIPLIASSIMSKKIAAGAECIVLDVKIGNGAFMRELSSAIELANLMVGIGCRAGRKTVAVVTDMNQPLGNAIGNALEVAEAIEVLNPGSGRSEYDFGEHSNDLVEVSLALAAELLLAAGIHGDRDAAVSAAERALESGDAAKRLACMIEAQHGDPRVIDDPGLLPRSARRLVVESDSDGYIGRIETATVGVCAQVLGAGRQKKNDTIDPAVGIVMEKRLGDKVVRGEALAVIHVNDDRNTAEAIDRLKSAVTIVEDRPEPTELIYKRISRPEGVA